MGVVEKLPAEMLVSTRISSGTLGELDLCS